MFVTVINDCKSANDFGRQATRLSSLLECPVNLVGVGSDLDNAATIEAAGNLIDMLDAAEDRKGFVIVNVAPRGDIKKLFHNGSPFCYFRFKNITVLSSIEGYTLSLVKKFAVTTNVNLVEIEKVLPAVLKQGELSSELVEHISKTQFRSYEYLPRLASWLHSGLDIPSEEYSLDQVPELEPQVWLIDTFGNIKTTLTTEDISWKPGQKVNTAYGEFNYYNRLKDVPKGEFGIYAGSSGLGNTRFIEIALQKGSAATELRVEIGSELKCEF